MRSTAACASPKLHRCSLDHTLPPELGLLQVTQALPHALRAGQWGTWLLDPVPTDLTPLLMAQGWRPIDGGWGRLHPVPTGTPAELQAQLTAVAEELPAWSDLVGQLHLALTSAGNLSAWAALETQLWPTHVVHPDLPAFLVPVGVRWLQRVFGTETAPRPHPAWHHGVALLSPVHPLFQPGARLLWVQRADQDTRLVGQSTLEQRQSGTTQDTLTFLQSLPGSSQREIQALAGEAQAQLTGVIATRPQTYPHPLTPVELEALGIRLGSGRTLSRRPLRLSATQYHQVMQQATGAAQG